MIQISDVIINDPPRLAVLPADQLNKFLIATEVRCVIRGNSEKYISGI